MLDPYWHTLTRTALRTVQLALTVAIAILYGIDLTHTTNKHAHARPEWIYADVTASLSGITCLTHLLLGTATTTATRMLLWSLWGFVLFVLWLAQVGVFGGIYVDWKGHYPGYYDDGSYGATRSVSRMKAGVWAGLLNTVLFFLCAVYGFSQVCCCCCGCRQTEGKLDGGDDDADVERGAKQIIH